jgi:hypothetical protein
MRMKVDLVLVVALVVVHLQLPGSLVRSPKPPPHLIHQVQLALFESNYFH